MVSNTHKSSDFIKLLEKFDDMYPAGDVIRIICDNHSAHKSKEVQNYLATKTEGHFIFVFTPTHGSWLNLIECFFSKMTKQELGNRIYKYFDEVNADPVVCHWSYKLDEIPSEDVLQNVASYLLFNLPILNLHIFQKLQVHLPPPCTTCRYSASPESPPSTSTQ